MAEYQVRKLYGTSTTVGSDSVTYESLWAYYIKYPTSETFIPGRFKIRINKMTASEFLALMGMDEEQYTTTSGYSIQAYVEKWSDKGWLHCLDWIGAPDTAMDEIEKTLCEMFKSFTTGQAADIEDQPVPVAPLPPISPTTSPKKTPDLQILKFPKKTETKDKKDKKGPDDDFDWI